MISFDAERHEYSEGGVILPSVTQILARAGLVDTTWHNATKTLLGSEVHEATAELDRGEKQYGDFAGQLNIGYLVSWSWWKWTSEARILEVESIVGGLDLGYAGTLDRLVMLDGELTVVDLKTGSPWAWHRLQLAAYALAVGLPCRRLAVYLQDGAWVKVREFRSPSDFGEWEKALAVVREQEAVA